MKIIYRTQHIRLVHENPYALPCYEQLCRVECDGIEGFMWLLAEGVYL